METNKIFDTENVVIEEVDVNENVCIEDSTKEENLSLDDTDEGNLSLEEPENLTDEQKALLKKILNERKNKVQK